MEVLKFGGTSVGTPEGMQRIADIVRQGSKKVVVLSALSGTTNQLTAISELLFQKEFKEALAAIDALEKHYEAFIDTLFDNEAAKLECKEYVWSCLHGVRSFANVEHTSFVEKSILAQGEMMSTFIFHQHLKVLGLRAVLLNSLDFMRLDKDDEPDEAYIARALQYELGRYPKKELFIAQGYICRNSFGEVDNLKRGGSDYSASLIGAAIQAQNIQIWTDIDGMHNNDPRFVEQTRPIRFLSFEEAAELAYFGAKILHPASIRPAQEENIPVYLKNTMNAEAEGTLIGGSTRGEEDIKAVAAKDGITAIKIRSARMLMAYGFLRKVFEVFERYKTPIDMITTSEVAVSVTIDDTTYLREITEELESIAKVELDTDHSILCVVGDFLYDKKGYASKIFTALADVPIRMISFGGSNNNVSLLVKSEDKVKALKALNHGLFNLD